MKLGTPTPRSTSTFRKHFLQLTAILGLALGLLAPTTARAVAPSSGVPFLDALSDARRITHSNSEWALFMVKGDSMEPHFGKNSMLLIDQCDFSALRVGMMVIYLDASGDYVAHRIIERSGTNWIAKGQNNSQPDPGLVTPSNFQGAVFGIIHYKEGTDELAGIDSTGKPQVALAKRY